MKCLQEKMDKIILVDVDGVLLNWEFAFITWMEQHGHTLTENHQYVYLMQDRFGINDDKMYTLVKTFNESATIGWLPALRDSVYYVQQLNNIGFQFTCITSLSTDQNAHKLRQMNLKKLFGNVFKEFYILNTNVPKDPVLEKFKDSGYWWVEDKIENAKAGLKYGLRPLLMEHGHNMYNNNPDIPNVKNWEDIYGRIINDIGISS